MNFFGNKIPETSPDATGRGSFLPFVGLRRRCARRECPERGRLWPRWRSPSEELVFQEKLYCSAACAESALEQEIERLLATTESEKPHRVPLGLLLVSRGLISGAQLQAALLRQKETSGLRLGAVLLESRALAEAALTAALGMQWGCPVFPLENSRAYLECAGLLPFPLLTAAGILPAHHSPATGVLHVACTKRVDYSLLYAIEQMCAVRAVPCVAADRLVAEALSRLQAAPLEDTVFDSVRRPDEMAHLTAGYAARLQATRVAVAGAAGHVWLRFANSRGSHHLLFRRPPQKHPAAPLR
jgi:hypothetical protein